MREETLYMLRLWRDGSGALAWRASLLELRTKELRHFGSVESLQAYLDERTHRTASGGADKEE